MTEPAETTLSLPGDDTPVLEAAIMYAHLGLAPIPIYGLTSDGLCTCPAGRHCTPKSRGKHPIGDGWQTRASIDEDEVRQRFAHHHGNVGISVRASGHVVIDADGDEAVAELESWKPVRTLRAQSGGKGAHLVYSLGQWQSADDISDRRVWTSGKRGIDVKIRGQFVVAPSLHVSGDRYRWVDPCPIATLPDDIYQRIRRVTSPPLSAPAPTSRGDLERRARAYIDRMPLAVSGQRGHDATFAVARALVAWVRKGLPEGNALAILAEYSARCTPPWSERELEHKWKQASAAHTVPLLEDRPRPTLVSIAGGRSSRQASPEHEDQMPPGPPGPPSGGGGGQASTKWMAELLWTEGKKGTPKLVNDFSNLIRILQLHPDWRGKLRWDELALRAVVTDPPWDAYSKPSSTSDAWTDADGVRLASWMRREMHRFSFSPSDKDCSKAVQVVAMTKSFHPIQEYLEGLVWDGKPRVDRWLVDYFGTTDDTYHRLAGRWWLVSAVARALDPGCKVDTVPILEGRQGIMKSTTIRALFGSKYFSDTPVDLNHKDAYQSIQGLWCVELAELDSLVRAEATRAKAFFSSSSDKFRPPYGHHDITCPRSCIFVGSTNSAEYLHDPTGERRYQPIKCAFADRDGVTRDRDQLWAEAVTLYLDGTVWYPESAEEKALFATVASARSVEDPWTEKVESYLSNPNRLRVTCGDVLENALGLTARDMNKASMMRVGVIIGKLGWSKRRTRGESGRTWVYDRNGGDE